MIQKIKRELHNCKYCGEQPILEYLFGYYYLGCRHNCYLRHELRLLNSKNKKAVVEKWQRKNKKQTEGKKCHKKTTKKKHR